MTLSKPFKKTVIGRGSRERLTSVQRVANSDLTLTLLIFNKNQEMSIFDRQKDSGRKVGAPWRSHS